VKHLWPLIIFVAFVAVLWFSSCVTSPPPYSPPIHSIQTITTVCPGPLCAICAADSENPQ